MKKSLPAIFAMMVIILSSCTLPGSANPTQPPVVMTAAAMTIQAVLATKPSQVSSPTALPGTSIPTKMPSASATATQPPNLTVGNVTDCRSGPDEKSERVTQIQPGEEVPIVGFYFPNYWIVNSKEGPCWIQVDFATPSGSYQTVPTVTAPPTPKGDAPKAPTFPQNGWSYFCPSPTQIDVTFNWNDNADNETGYRIYRNDEVVKELPANSKTFSESATRQPDETLTYKIEAYNDAGTASSSVVTIKC